MCSLVIDMCVNMVVSQETWYVFFIQMCVSVCMVMSQEICYVCLLIDLHVHKNLLEALWFVSSCHRLACPHNFTSRTVGYLFSL